jgi:hypothetical protein
MWNKHTPRRTTCSDLIVSGCSCAYMAKVLRSFKTSVGDEEASEDYERKWSLDAMRLILPLEGSRHCFIIIGRFLTNLNVRWDLGIDPIELLEGCSRAFPGFEQRGKGTVLTVLPWLS